MVLLGQSVLNIQKKEPKKKKKKNNKKKQKNIVIMSVNQVFYFVWSVIGNGDCIYNNKSDSQTLILYLI